MNSQSTPRQTLNTEAPQADVANPEPATEPIVFAEDDLADDVPDEDFMTLGRGRVVTPRPQAGPDEIDFVYLWFYS